MSATAIISVDPGAKNGTSVRNLSSGITVQDSGVTNDVSRRHLSWNISPSGAIVCGCRGRRRIRTRPPLVMSSVLHRTFNVRRDEIAPLAAATLVGFYALIVLTPQNVGERSGLLIGIVHIGM